MEEDDDRPQSFMLEMSGDEKNVFSDAFEGDISLNGSYDDFSMQEEGHVSEYLDKVDPIKSEMSALSNKNNKALTSFGSMSTTSTMNSDSR